MKDFNTLITRTATGAIFVAVIIGALLYDSLAAFAVFGVVMYISLIEFYNLVSKKISMAKKLVAMLIYSATYFYATAMIDISPLYFISPFLVCFAIVELYNKNGKTLKNIAYDVFASVYIVLPFSLINIMLNDGTEFNGMILLAIFFLVWVNDTFAYLFGVSLGKHRMWERISPKKSWEGFIGGALSTAVVSYFGAKYFFPEMIWQMVGLSLVVVVFGTYGDLFESQLKRQFGVKDSGNILPGHGGFLDRFDSFLFIIPMAMVYLQIVA